MVKRLIALAGVLLLCVASVSGAQAATLARKHRPIIVVVHRPLHRVAASKAPANTMAGQLTAMNGSVLTFTSQSVVYTINVSSATKLVRLYNGPSALDEFSVGDNLLVVGTTAANNTINATRIKDQSIQRAWTRVVGTLGPVSGAALPATASLAVIRDHRLAAPFSVGQTLTLHVSASTSVIASTATGTPTSMGTTALSTLSASASATVTVLGTYNRTQQSFTTVYRIFIHRAH